jgi:hypothetical protein
MRFLVVEKVRMGSAPGGSSDFAKEAEKDLKFKMQLQKKGKIIGGGPFLDTLGDCYILETKTIEEMGEIFFNSPSNFYVDREVHPLGSFQDSYEGMRDLGE